MRIPPKNPHFFKVILPGFQDGLKIPVSFSKYLDGERSEYMELRRGVKKWRVKINGLSLEEGWRSFAVENNLEVGDFVVFKHVGNMVFQVMVFEPSHCERECSWIDDVENAEQKEKETSYKKKFISEGSRWNLARTHLTTKNAISIDTEGTLEEESVSTPKSRKVSSHDDEEPDNPYFVSSIKPYCIKWSTLQIPMRFARANNLINRRRNLILRDPQQRSWHVESVPNVSHVCIRRGWDAFFTGNGLKLGDTFKFELVEDGETPILNFIPCMTRINKPRLRPRPRPQPQPQPRPHLPMKMNRKRIDKKLEAASKSKGHPYFVSNIKPYSIRNPVLHLPMKFARSTGLIRYNGEMILRDERQRSWLVTLKHDGSHVLISTGWGKFRISNGLKEGDVFKFELIRMGKRPFANFYCEFSFLLSAYRTILRILNNKENHGQLHKRIREFRHHYIFCRVLKITKAYISL